MNKAEPRRLESEIRNEQSKGEKIVKTKNNNGMIHCLFGTSGR